MKDLDQRLAQLGVRVNEAESLIRALRQENARLKAALDGKGEGHATDGGHGDGGRSLRVLALEAEREQVRSRIRNLLEAL